jgi:hypothetical protein
MSGGAIFRETLGVVLRQRLPEASHEDILATLEAAPREPLEFIYEAGAEAKLPHEDILVRGAAIYFNFCAGSLCDDLSDSDCYYLKEPYRVGPCVQAILQTLFFETLVKAKLPKSVLSSAARELIAAVGVQHVELHTRKWTAELFRKIAEGIGGRQWSAYLQILWCRTPLALRAARIGMAAGIAVVVTEDMQSLDRRFATLSAADKYEIVAWAATAVKALREEHVRCIDALLCTIDPILRTVP